MRLSSVIRFGTERYPENVARRLRVMNLSAWTVAIFAGGFAVSQFLSSGPGLWPAAIANTLGALACAAVPLLHRFGPYAAPAVFATSAYALIVADIWILGTDTLMQIQFLAVAAASVLFFGTERAVFTVICGIVAVVLIIVVQVSVPPDTGTRPPGMLFANLVASTAGTAAILLSIVFFAVRDVARAEAVAAREFARSESLLGNILPPAIAARLKDCPQSVIADRYDEASVLFADMAGFTAQAGETAPDDLILFLNRVFSEFDQLVERHGLEKIKTTGDAYMVVSGVPEPRPDHAQALALLAIEMREAAREWRDPHGRSVPVRIGISSGPVVAGVVGTRKFFYDVWGDAVNVASRMESTGEPGKIQIAQSTRELLTDDFRLTERGLIDVKGKGQMPTWLLIGRKADSKE